MVDEKTKAQIDAKLKLANIDHLTQENCGKLKRVAQLLYNDDKEKKMYMMLEIAKRNPNIAMEIAKGLNDNAQIIEKIAEFTNSQSDIVESDPLVKIINEYHQGNLVVFVTGLLEISSELKYKERGRIMRLFANYKQFLLFLETCLANNLVDDLLFAHFIDEYSFSFGDVMEAQKETYSLANNLVAKKCYNACAILIREIGIYKFYRLYHIAYHDFNKIMSKQSVIKNPDKIELGYCRASYAKDFNGYLRYRNKYKNHIESKAMQFYQSLLYEYISAGEYKEEHIALFEELEQYPINIEDIEHGEVFSTIAIMVQNCIEKGDDVLALLETIKRVNICRMDYQRRVFFFKYDKGVLLEESGNDILQKYMNQGHSLDDLFTLYFNSYLKFAVSINKFFRMCAECEGFTEKMKAWLPQQIFLGKVSVKDNQLIMILPYHFNAERNMACPMTPQELNKFSKGEEVAFQLEWKEYYVDFSNIKPATDIEAQIRENIEPALIHIQSMCEDGAIAKDVREYLKSHPWNDMYKFTKQYVYYDFAYFFAYEQQVRQIMHLLVRNTYNVELLIDLYLNSFFKVALSINEFYSIISKVYSMEKIEASFDNYVFHIKTLSRDDISYRPVQLKMYGAMRLESHENMKLLEGRFIAKFKGIDEDGVVRFVYDNENTYNLIIKEGYSAMLRAFCRLRTATFDSREIYDRIRRIPLEYYDANISLKNEIAEIICDTMEKKAHALMELANYIKRLSLHNVYCSRLDMDPRWDALAIYQYDNRMVERAMMMTKTMARNSDAIGRCLFVFINSFIKQYMSVEEFIDLSLAVNPKLTIEDTSYEITTLGDVKLTEEGNYVYMPTSLACTKVFPVMSNAPMKRAGALLKLIYKDNKVDWQMIKELWQ